MLFLLSLEIILYYLILSIINGYTIHRYYSKFLRLKTNLISCLLCLQDGNYLHVIGVWRPKIVLTSVLTSCGLNVSIVVLFDCTLRPIRSRQSYSTFPTVARLCQYTKSVLSTGSSITKCVRNLLITIYRCFHRYNLPFVYQRYGLLLC